MSNIEHRAVIKFFTRKALNTTEINKQLDSVYKDFVPPYRTVAKWVAGFKDPEHGFEDAPRSSRPSTAVTIENIQAVERLLMCDRSISIHRGRNY